MWKFIFLDLVSALSIMASSYTHFVANISQELAFLWASNIPLCIFQHILLTISWWSSSMLPSMFTIVISATIKMGTHVRLYMLKSLPLDISQKTGGWYSRIIFCFFFFWGISSVFFNGIAFHTPTNSTLSPPTWQHWIFIEQLF